MMEKENFLSLLLTVSGYLEIECSVTTVEGWVCVVTEPHSTLIDCELWKH